mmetsp:Transcript_9361/g.35037  ORF Transcript_9361/g.35037 Transcript_9361/m.35037 type:complete len:206 (+) Transcript_9361:8652-9269(+)
MRDTSTPRRVFAAGLMALKTLSEKISSHRFGKAVQTLFRRPACVSEITPGRSACKTAICKRRCSRATSFCGRVKSRKWRMQNSKDFSPSASSTPAPSPCEPRRTALTPPNIDTIGSRPEKSASSTRRHQAARDRTIATMHGYISFVKWQSKASQIRAKCAARVLSPFVSSHSMAPVITARASPRAAASSISAYSGTDSSATQLSQ